MGYLKVIAALILALTVIWTLFVLLVILFTGLFQFTANLINYIF